MHVEPGIAERRIRNLLDQRIRPAIYGPGSPLSVTAHHVEGEPIGVAEAERADYLPFAVGDPWGPSWGTSWFRFSGTVPKHLADRRVEAIIDLGFIRGQVGFNAEGLIWRAGAPLHGLHPERQWSLISQEARGGERVDLLVEAAANPFVNLNVVTDLGDLATAPTSPQYRLARAEVAPLNTEVWHLALEIDFLLRLGGRIGAPLLRHRARPHRHRLAVAAARDPPQVRPVVLQLTRPDRQRPGLPLRLLAGGSVPVDDR